MTVFLEQETVLNKTDAFLVLAAFKLWGILVPMTDLGFIFKNHSLVFDNDSDKPLKTL